MNTTETSRRATVEPSYGQVKALTDKLFTTIRQARSNEDDGKTNLVSVHISHQDIILPYSIYTIDRTRFV